MNPEILKCIKLSKKEYEKKSQRAELLLRNEQFLKELSETSADAVVDFKDRKKFKTKKISTDGVVLYIDTDKLLKFRKFCLKWHISPQWDGNKNTLSEFIKDSPEVIHHSFYYLKSGESPGIPDVERIKSVDLAGPDYLYIKIDAWTTLEDIKKIWPRIDKVQKKIFNYKAEMKSNFSRDLCWYDLKTKFNLSYGKIAKLWIEHYPEDIDSIVIKKFKKENEKLLKEKLPGRTSLLEFNAKLLEMVVKGELGKEVSSRFEEDRSFYITGKTKSGKLTPRFLDAIRQAVQRMQSYIEQLEIPEEVLLDFSCVDAWEPDKDELL